jgi:thiol-disulfide isomerase/thioredoxin
LFDFPCTSWQQQQYAVVDVVSVLGTEQNVSSHITKWHVDAAGIRQRYQGRNKQQKDIELYDSAIPHSIEELHENGEDAISLDEETFEYARKEQEYLFVDFYASWCSHCRQLAPTWETLAEVMTAVAEHLMDEEGEHVHQYTDEELKHATKVKLPVMVAKVDCVSHDAFCRKQGIRAYPTLRLFVDGERWSGGDYRGHRTVVEMADYLQQVEDTHKTELEKEDPKNVRLAHDSTYSNTRK